MSTYRYNEPAQRTFSLLPDGDYLAVIAAAEEPYIKENGKHVMKTTLAIQPSGSTVLYSPWTGETQSGEFRDNIGELLLAANRVPANKQEEPDWGKLIGAKIKVRLKTELDQNGIKRNVVHYVHTPKKAEVSAKPTEQKFSQSEFMKARGKQIEASGGGEPEPDNIPY